MNRLQEGFVLGDRYRLESRIASGGMADVWRGTDDVLQRHVAVKIMRPDIDHERLFALRFRDEAVHSAALMHTNIATVFDYGEDDGLAFLVMELVEGEPLSAILNKRGPLPPHEVRSIMGQAALALGVAHEARVVHRDIKPANIMVREDGLVKLTDFGIARALDASGHTQHGEMLGTPNYISPEQALGHAATGASDLYALGVVAHEMLVGQRPFDRGTPIATALSHVNEAPPPLPDTVPADLRELITECLEKDPEQRPANAATVAVRLGMGDQELRGLALGLATAINGSPADMIENVEELAEEVAHHASPTVEGDAAPVDDAAGLAAGHSAGEADPDSDGLEPTRAMPAPTSTPVAAEREDTARGA